MGLNDTPRGERVHIGIFGKRNAGKSSIINAITNQKVSIVSEVAGTTTDPVYKAMELLPIGPVMIIDTPGIDDEGDLGKARVKASYNALNKCDCAVVIADGRYGISKEDEMLIEKIKQKGIPYVLVYNKCDGGVKGFKDAICCSAKTGENIDLVREKITQAVKKEDNRPLVSDLLDEDDVVLLVVPIDSAAPKGRLILPQQQTIRDIIDKNAQAIVVKEDKVAPALEKLKVDPKMVICDSQVFGKVDKDTPKRIKLTSFSILFARYKGDLRENIKGARKLDELENNDTVLISEGCTHRRQCGDIGTVKLPAWLRKYTGKKLNFEFTSGGEFPEDLSKYALVIHCGGCMITQREMKYRINCAMDNNVPIVNYGIAIAHMNGILKRSLEPFGDLD